MSACGKWEAQKALPTYVILRFELKSKAEITWTVSSGLAECY